MIAPTFSERHGLAPQAGPIKVRQDAPPELRGPLPRLAYDCGFSPKTLRPLVCSVTLRAEDPSNWTDDPNIEGEIRDILDQCDWFEVYDMIEAIAGSLQERDERNWNDGTGRLEVFTSRINRASSKYGIGWQLIDGRVEVRGEEFFEIVARPTTQALGDADRATSATELHEAIQDLSRRPVPDITGAIQHAMAAVECFARQVTDDKGTLGGIIKRHPGLLPPPLDAGIEKL